MANVFAVLGISPHIHPSAFVADNARIMGDVELGPEVNVWYGAVLRGDVGQIRIGARSNVQDLACIHMSHGISHSEIGEDVTIGHGAIIHGAIIGNGALIGMGSILLDNCEIGEEALVAAGTVVPPRFKVPARHMVRGQPGKIIRPLTAEEVQLGRQGAQSYLALARAHQAASSAKG